MEAAACGAVLFQEADTPGPPPPSNSGCGFESLATTGAGVRLAHPQKVAEVWAEDEARLGLKPIARRVWSLGGDRPRSNGRHKFASLYVFGYAHPATGRNRTAILPKASAGAMSASLVDFARWADPEGTKVRVVALDRAGWHVAKELKGPPNVVLFHLPPSTPELQPVEPLWPLVREALANKTFAGLVALQEPLVKRCGWLADHPEVVKGAIGLHWAAALG